MCRTNMGGERRPFSMFIAQLGSSETVFWGKNLTDVNGNVFLASLTAFESFVFPSNNFLQQKF